MSQKRARPILGAVGWGLMALLSLGIAAHGLSYLLGARAPEVVIDNAMGMRVLMVHASASGVALLFGPLQFIDAIRRRAPKVHHWIGRIYLAACFVGGVAGLLLAPFTAAGAIAASGFFFLAVFWLWFNIAGLRAALMRNFPAHKSWMIRSFALTFAAVTLRLYLIPPMIADWDFIQSYQVIAWISWVPNLLIAEAWLASRRRAPAFAPA